MEDQTSKLKQKLKEYTPIIITTASLTTLVVLTIVRKNDGQWQRMVIEPEQLKEMMDVESTKLYYPTVKMVLTRPIPGLDD